MTQLERIISRIISEAIERSDINNIEASYVSKIYDAIDKRYEVKFAYNDGSKNPATMQRRVQIVAYGLSKSGNPVIRAYQPAGGSKRGTPAWKMFRLDRIVPNSWRVMRKKNGSIVHFDEPPGPYMGGGAYNPDGDKSMSQCIKSADFKKAAEKRSTSYVAQKADYEKIRKQQDLLQRNLQNIQNQEENPILAKNMKNNQLHPDMQKFLKGGTIDKKPMRNNPAMNDMERVAQKQDFGLKDSSKTVGPQYKGKTARTIPNNNDTNFKQAEKNGPYYSDSVKTQEDLKNKEEEKNNTDNGQQ